MIVSLPTSARWNAGVRALMAGLAGLALVGCTESSQPTAASPEADLAVSVSRRANAIWLSNSGQAQAYDVNDHGVVVGGDNGIPVRWTTRGRRELPSLDPASPYGVAYAINGAGQVAGISGFPWYGPPPHATLWSADGVAADLGVLAGGTFSIANAISETGQAVGYADTREHVAVPVSWRPGAPAQPLSIWPGHVAGYATGVNDAGEIIGYSLDVDGNPHAILWTHGRMVDLGARAYPWGINNSTVVVGDNRAAGYSVPFRWTPNAGMKDLPNCQCGAAGYSINDRGVIVGAQAFGFGGLIPVIWTPGLKVVYPEAINSLWVQAMAVSPCGHIAGQVDDEWSGGFAILWPGENCQSVPTPSSELAGSRIERDRPARLGARQQDWSLPRAPVGRSSR